MGEIDSHVALARTALDNAIARLEAELASFSAKRKPNAPRVDAKKIASKCESIPDGQDLSELVEKLVLFDTADGDAGGQSRPDSLAQKASRFAGQLVPLTSVALGLVGRILDGSTVASELRGSPILR